MQTVWENGLIYRSHLLDFFHLLWAITAWSQAWLLWYNQINSVRWRLHLVDIVLLSLIIWTVYTVIIIIRVQNWLLKRTLVRADRLLLGRLSISFRHVLLATCLYFSDPRHKLLLLLFSNQLLSYLLTDLLCLHSVRRSVIASPHEAQRLTVVHDSLNAFWILLCRGGRIVQQAARVVRWGDHDSIVMMMRNNGRLLISLLLLFHGDILEEVDGTLNDLAELWAYLLTKRRSTMVIMLCRSWLWLRMRWASEVPLILRLFPQLYRWETACIPALISCHLRFTPAATQILPPKRCRTVPIVITILHRSSTLHTTIVFLALL